MPRVFVSHAYSDLPLIQGLQQLLTQSGLLTNEELFISSLDGFDVKDGNDFVSDIRQELATTDLFVPVVTPAYLDSEFCTWELGAAWAMELPWLPIRLGLSPDALPLLLKTRQVKPIGRPSLDRLSSEIQKLTGRTITDHNWGTARDKFLETLPGSHAQLLSNWKQTPRAQERHQARVGQSSKTLLEVMAHIREAGWLALRSQNDADPTAFKNMLRVTSRLTRQLFTQTTGCPVRVAIRQLIRLEGQVPTGQPNGSGLGVVDLVRDTHRNIRRRVDPVEATTAFNQIVQGAAEFFASNRLSAIPGFKGHHHPGSPTPYESTVVWPIRKPYEDTDVTNWFGLVGHDDYLGGDFLGFLCVDSPKPDAFTIQDQQLAGVIAEALYTPLRLWRFSEHLALQGRGELF